MSREVATDVGTYGGETVQVLGHWLYCRKCATPELADGIVIPEELREASNWVEVLAVGPKVGRPREWSKKKLRERKVARCLPDYYRVGDLLLMPNTHPWGLKRSPINPMDEFWVDEAIPLAIMAGDGHDSSC